MTHQKAFNRVLIIDDDHISVYLTRIILEEMGVAEEILTAYEGKEGLEVFKQHCLNAHTAKIKYPDLILLDIHMPIMSGIEVVKELHRIRQNNLLEEKIIVLTTSSYPRDVEIMASLGVKHYITKPITADKILLLVGKIAI